MKYVSYVFLIASLLIGTSFAQEHPSNPKPFTLWLQEFKQEALTHGISKTTLDDAFADTEPLDRVIELDHKQPESVLTIEQYLANVITKKRVRDGKNFLKENHALLKKIGARYGVQPRFIVALWGIETNYGRNTGNFETIDALATLAYDGRRSDYFRDELLKALQILEAENMSAADMEGSWAGALGQCQFMPTSFLKYAVDYNKDGKRDIWNTKADVFASIANYLKSSGWNSNDGWGRKIQLPDGFNRKLAVINQERPLEEWRRLGVRKENGGVLPTKKIKASLIFVGEGEDAVPYIIYGNYKVLLQWNRSRFFATAVGTLADKLGK
jgi:membrane-bound lytic murein transglycosylase B